MSVIVPLAAPRSARQRPWNEAAFVALDFELTGLDPRSDDVISFGVVPIDAGRIVMARSLYGLVQPTISPSPASVTIHGLRDQDLQTAPGPEYVRARLADALNGRFLVTWHAAIENAFLAKLFGGRPRPRWWARRNVDVRGLAMAAAGGPRGERVGLASVADLLGVPVADPHHALDDALVTAQLFLVLATRLAARHRGTVRHLLRTGRSTSIPDRWASHAPA